MKKKGIYENACYRHLYLVCHVAGPVFRPHRQRSTVIRKLFLSSTNQLRLFSVALVYATIMTQF